MLERAFFVFGRAVRETGQAIERVGLKVVDKPLFKESSESPLACGRHGAASLAWRACRRSALATVVGGVFVAILPCIIVA
jgi:hypothetical protein